MNDFAVTTQALDILAPAQQEGTKAVLRTWLKSEGATVSKDEPVAELETDKVVVEVCAPCAGVLRYIMPLDSDAPPGSLLGRVESGATETEVSVGEPTQEPAELSSALASDHRLSPAVRRLVAENSLDVRDLANHGTGRGGRLTRQDVIHFIANKPASAQQLGAYAKAQPSQISPTAPAVSGAQSEPLVREPASTTGGPSVASLVPHSSMRRKIAEHMQHSVSVAPHVTSVFEIDFTAIMAHRRKHKAEFASQGVNLTFTAYFIAACVHAMKAAPEVNSRWHADHLELFRDINIGVGAALGDKGLIVPVIHNTQDLSLIGIASRLQALTESARNGKLKPSDVQGGTFTISNHGVSGSLFASPIIINQPQSAILGVGAVEKRVVVKEVDGLDTIQVRPLAYVSLTIDHRVLDGSQTNAWLTRFKQVIESWPVA